MKITVQKIYISDKKRDGSPLVSKQGKPYKKISIKTAEYPDKWLSGFYSDDMRDWSEGDTKDVIVEQNGDFLNFKLPTKTDGLEERVRILEGQIKVLQAFIKGQDEASQMPPEDVPEEIQVEDIPF